MSTPQRTTEARVVAMDKAGLTARRVKREVSICNADNSVEFHFFSKADASILLARVMVNADDSAILLDG